jgi:hypothetical protein
MKYKYFIGGLVLAACAIMACYGFLAKPEGKRINKMTKKGFAVVELFTSEGCSSCPPADEAIAELLAKNIQDVFVLSYHVDYWNRLGWKDEFSKPAFSARQSQYARYLSLDGIYTPQAIVNGAHQFVGSNKNQLNSTVLNSLQSEASNLNITAQKDGNKINVSYTISGTDMYILNIALIQPKAVTAVKRGENGGRSLTHVNIVRELKTVDAIGSGQTTIAIPDELIGLPLQVISYTQSKKNFKVFGADQAKL